MPLLVGEDGDWPERTLYIQWQRGNEPQLLWQLRRDLGALQTRSEPNPRKANGAQAALRTLRHQGRPRRAERHRRSSGKRLSGGLRQATKAGSATSPRLEATTRRESSSDPSTRTPSSLPARIGGPRERTVGAIATSATGQVEVAAAGSYDIRFRFSTQTRAGRAEFRLGKVKLRKPFTTISRIRHVSRSRARCRRSKARSPPRPWRQDRGRKVRGCDEVGVGFLVVYLISSVTYI